MHFPQPPAMPKACFIWRWQLLRILVRRRPGSAAIPFASRVHRRFCLTLPTDSPEDPFSFGYPRKAHGKIDWHLGYRLANHLKHHRSQRPYQLPEGVTYYQHLQTLSLQFLRLPTRESR